MKLTFAKMQGLGNDFMVINTLEQDLLPTPEQVRRLADRRCGVGFDQLLVVSAPQEPEHDFHYQIFNADSSESAQCGNGARCVARYLYGYLTNKNSLILGTAGEPLTTHLLEQGQVRVSMGIPKSLPPLQIEWQDAPVQVLRINLGNEHALIQTQNLQQLDTEREGRWFQGHPQLQQYNANIGFVQIKSRGQIELMVYEYGAGLTPACGSGACAAVAALIAEGQLDSEVEICFKAGSAWVGWPDAQSQISLTGPTGEAYQGEVDL